MLRTETGRVSRTMLIHLILGIAGQSLALVGWLANVLSPQTWAVVAGVLGTVQAIAGIIERGLAGRAASDGSVRGEPIAKKGSPKGKGPLARRSMYTLVLGVLLSVGCATQGVPLTPLEKLDTAERHLRTYLPVARAAVPMLQHAGVTGARLDHGIAAFDALEVALFEIIAAERVRLVDEAAVSPATPVDGDEAGAGVTP